MLFDIGGPELLLIVVVGVMVIGPKELPNAIRTVTAWVRKARSLAREFRSGVEEMVREAELDKLQDEVKGEFDEFAIENQIHDTIDPTGEIRDSFDGDWYSDDAEFGVEDDDDTEDVVGAVVEQDAEPDDDKDGDVPKS